MSAWSCEALEAAASLDPNPEAARQALKWSYADSPYLDYGDCFASVRLAFEAHPRLTATMPATEWSAECLFRLQAMEQAMRELDQEDLFGKGPARKRVVVTVEVIPPDETNIARTLRLNPEAASAAWLSEAAEWEPAPNEAYICLSANVEEDDEFCDLQYATIFRVSLKNGSFTELAKTGNVVSYLAARKEGSTTYF